MAELQIRPRSLQLRSGLLTGGGLRVGLEGFWVRFGDGLGEVTLLPGFGTESLEQARGALNAAAAALSGSGPPASPDEVEQRIDAIAALASCPASRAGVELALLDAASRQAGVPLAGWLGSTERVVRVNALLTEDTPMALSASARARVREGFDTLKVKVGAASLEVDHQRLKAVREAVGPDVRLRIDGNGAWSEAEARQRLTDCAPFRLEYVEQPVAAADIDALRRLRSLARIAADETLGLPGAEEALLGGDRPAVDVLVFKLPSVGGLLRARRIAARAWQLGVEVTVTSALDGAVSRAGAAHLACTLPPEGPADGLATGHLLEHDPGSYSLSHGILQIPDDPGLGIDAAVLGW
jgi:L-Ala-D/L-Glu epimerase